MHLDMLNELHILFCDPKNLKNFKNKKNLVGKYILFYNKNLNKKKNLRYCHFRR
jgi:hypothetical protein